MQAFLSPDRQKELRQILGESADHTHLSQKAIDKFVTFPDDIKEVDRQLYCHARCIVKFTDERDMEQVTIGLACITSIMAEALERGYGETDFPISYAFIKADVLRREEQTKQPPTIQ